MGVGGLGGGDHLGLGRVGAAEGDVVPNRVVQHQRLLQDDGHLLPQVRQVQLAQVVAVEQDAACRGVGKAQEKLQQA